jgi:hypothetical protein
VEKVKSHGCNGSVICIILVVYNLSIFDHFNFNSSLYFFLVIIVNELFIAI